MLQYFKHLFYIYNDYGSIHLCESIVFFKFVKENQYLLITAAMMIILAYGYALSTIDDLSIDEEVYFQGNTASHTHNWIGFSRYGMALISSVLFPVFDAVPYLNGILSVLLMGTAAIALCYYIQEILAPHKVPKVGFAFLTAAVIAYPSNIDYLGFNSINAGVSVGLLLSVISAFLITRWVFEKQSIGNALLGTIIAAFVFSIYQAFVGVYLTLIVLFSLLYILKEDLYGQRMKTSVAMLAVLKHAAVLAISLVVFYAGDFLVRLITGIKSNGYTEGLSQATSVRQMLLNMKYNLEIYFTDYISDGYILACTVALFALSVVLYLFAKSSRNRLLVALLSFALVLAPFSLGVLWAGVVPRVLTAILMMVGFCGFLVVFLVEHAFTNPFEKHPKLKESFVALCTLLVVIVSYAFIYYDNLSAYASHVRYVRDESFARLVAAEVIDEIKEDAPEAPVVLVGNYTIKEMENGNTVGYSASQFNYDNTHFRGVCLMNYLGFKFTYPSRDELAYAEELAAEMPIWPAEGCIQKMDGLIIVKLSEID